MHNCNSEMQLSSHAMYGRYEHCNGFQIQKSASSSTYIPIHTCCSCEGSGNIAMQANMHPNAMNLTAIIMCLIMVASHNPTKVGRVIALKKISITSLHTFSSCNYGKRSMQGGCIQNCFMLSSLPCPAPVKYKRQWTTSQQPEPAHIPLRGCPWSLSVIRSGQWIALSFSTATPSL